MKNTDKYLLIGTDKNGDEVVVDELETVYLAVKHLLTDGLYEAEDIFIAKRVDWNVIDEEIPYWEIDKLKESKKDKGWRVNDPHTTNNNLV